MQVISIKQQSEYAERTIRYFQKQWASEESMQLYEDCITRSITSPSSLPQWYLLMDNDTIIGCAGLIVNDFISWGDVWPWLCALYVEETYRGQRLSQLLINTIQSDAATLGFTNLYLCTDHQGLYEKFGFEYLGTGYHPWGESSRVYGKSLTK